MSSSKCPVIPTCDESLVWNKPERNRLDKMWLDSGEREFDSGVVELYRSSPEYIYIFSIESEALIQTLFEFEDGTFELGCTLRITGNYG